MSPKQDDISRYYDSLDEAKAEGFTLIKVTQLCQFYTLSGRKVSLLADNLCPIPGLSYVVQGSDLRYYLRDFRGFSVRELVFYYRDKISPVIEEIEALQRYVYDDRVQLLFTQEMIEDMKLMLARAYKSRLSGEGTLRYTEFYELLNESLSYEDYRTYGSNLIGFKTVCKQFDERLDAMWKKAYERNNKK